MKIAYTIELADLHGHYFDVSLELERDSGGDLDLSMAAWTPGSYFIRNYARNVESVRATAAGDAPLKVVKTDRQTWRIDAGEARRLVVRYRVYGFDESVRGAHLSDEEGFFTGAALYLRVRGAESDPATVRVVAPQDWNTISTSLSPLEGAPNTYLAGDFDELVDAPFLVGRHEVRSFDHDGRPHEVAISGQGNHDAERLVTDLHRIVAAASKIFGHTPYDRYTFILRLTESDWGGLEHGASNVSVAPGDSFRPDKTYRSRVLGLLAHEFFHLWNIKRLRPLELGPFDYDREVHTTMLWLAEGVTSYYDTYILRRAGVLSPEEYLEALGKTITGLARVPGRFEDSLEQSSWDAWIKLYINDENSLNRSVSYYLKGGIAMFALDLDMRARTGGQRGLEDALAALYQRYHLKEGRGITTEEMRAVCEEVAGGSLAQHFDVHIGEPGDIELAPYLAPFGLRLEHNVDREGLDANDPEGGWLGAALDQPPGKGVMVARVPKGSPAMQGGLYARDEILAIDGSRVRSTEQATARLREHAAGEVVEILVSRRGQVRVVPVSLGELPADRHRIVKMNEPTDSQQALYERLLFAAW